MEFIRKRMIFTALKEEVGNTKSKESLPQGQRDSYCWQLPNEAKHLTASRRLHIVPGETKN